MKRLLISHNKLIIISGIIVLCLTLLLAPYLACLYEKILEKILGYNSQLSNLSLELIGSLIFGLIVSIVAFSLQLLHENVEKNKLNQDIFIKLKVGIRKAFKRGKTPFNIYRFDAMFYFDETSCNGLYQTVSPYRDYFNSIKEYIGHKEFINKIYDFITLMDTAYELGDKLNYIIRKLVNKKRFELNGPINTDPFNPFICVRAMMFKKEIDKDTLKIILGVPKGRETPGELDSMLQDIKANTEITTDIKKIIQIKKNASLLGNEIKNHLRKIDFEESPGYNISTMKRWFHNLNLKRSIKSLVLLVIIYVVIVEAIEFIALKLGVSIFDDSDKENLVQIALLVGAILAFKETVALRKVEHEPVLSLGINTVKKGNKDDHMLEWCFAFDDDTREKGRYLTIRNCGKGGAFNLKQERGDLRNVDIEKFSNLFVAPKTNVHIKLNKRLDNYNELDNNQFVISCKTIEGDEFFGRYSITNAEKGYVTMHEWTRDESEIGKNTI